MSQAGPFGRAEHRQPGALLTGGTGLQRRQQAVPTRRGVGCLVSVRRGKGAAVSPGAQAVRQCHPGWGFGGGDHPPPLPRRTRTSARRAATAVSSSAATAAPGPSTSPAWCPRCPECPGEPWRATGTPLPPGCPSPPRSAPAVQRDVAVRLLCSECGRAWPAAGGGRSGGGSPRDAGGRVMRHPAGRR